MVINNVIDPIAISIGPINIAWYAICILSGIIIAIIVGINLGKKKNIPKELIIDGVTYGSLFGILGARIYYVLFNLDIYLQDPISIFKVYEGGLAIHGAIITGFIYAFYYCKKHKLNFLDVADIVAIGFLIAQAIGRYGNFINQEAYGPITSLERLQELHIPKFIIDGMFINGDFHIPTFFYESIWNIIGFIILVILFKKDVLKRGEYFFSYLIWYSIGRFYIEGLRTDSLMVFGLKTAQLISIFLIIAGIAGFIVRRLKYKEEL